MMKKIIALIVLSINTINAQDYAISKIPENLLNNANAVIRDKSIEYAIKSENSLEYKFKSVITIINKAGDDLSYIYIPYDKSTKISDVKCRIFDNDGKLLKTLSKSDLQDIAQSQDSYLYTDDRALAARVVQPTYPYTIEYVYSAKSSDTAFLMPLQPYMSTGASVQNWSETFYNDSNIVLRKNVKPSLIGIPNVVEDKNKLVVSFTNLPAIKEEKYSPDISTLVSRVDFALDKACLKGRCGDFSTWQNLAIWYQGLLDEVSDITPEIQQEVNSLNLKGTTKEKVKTIYQYMQNKTRYVFVGIGIGGWQPMNVDDVRKKAYGDCKALTNYTRVLLKAAGIKSYYAKIYMDGTPIMFDEEFPKMGGNHVVLYVPTEEGDVWLENTNQNIAFNHLGFSTRNRNAVLLDRDNTKVINTPVYDTSDSFKNVKITANLKLDHSLDAKSYFTFDGGWYDFYLDFVSKTKKESEETIKNYYYYLKLSKLDFFDLENNKDKGELSYKMDFSVTDFSKNIGDELYFNALTFVNADFYLDNIDERRFPLEITFGYNDNYEIEYNLPDGYNLSELKLPIKIDSEYGSYMLEIKPEDNKIVVKRKFVLNKGIIPVNKIADYIGFRKKINRADATKLLIHKK